MKNIKHFLSEGKIEEALNSLLAFSKSKGKKFQQQSILLSSQFQKWKKDRLRGIQHDRSEVNRIEWAILEMLDSSYSDSQKRQFDTRKKPLVLLSIFILITTMVFTMKDFFVEKSLYEQFLITSPNTKEIHLSLSDSCSYLIPISGTGKRSNEVKLIGKFWHGGEWYVNRKNALIHVNPNGDWSISFFHGCHVENGISKKPSCRESFKFGLFLYEEGVQLEDMNNLIKEIKFEVILKDDGCKPLSLP